MEIEKHIEYRVGRILPGHTLYSDASSRPGLDLSKYLGTMTAVV